MLSRRLIISALVLIPTIASAQKKTRGDKEADWNKLDKETASGASGLKISNKDVENMSPVKLLIDKRKDLKISDDQLKQLKAQDDKLKETTKPLFKALDSLRNVMRPTPNPKDDDRARALSAQLSVATLMTDFAGVYKTAADDATAVLDETQKGQAAPLLAQQKTDGDALLREKLTGRGGRG